MLLSQLKGAKQWTKYRGVRKIILEAKKKDEEKFDVKVVRSVGGAGNSNETPFNIGAVDYREMCYWLCNNNINSRNACVPPHFWPTL